VEVAVFTTPEVFVSHRNARVTFHGRRLLVQRVRVDGMPIAQVANAMGVSRPCAQRGVARDDREGDAGLWDRSSRPHTMPTRPPAEVEQRVLAARVEHRRGPDGLGPELGFPARTVTRIRRRHGVPRRCACDPVTGEVIRAAKVTAVRSERDRPGELVHMDVKTIGRIPDGGGGNAHGRQMGSTAARKQARIGSDSIHSLVDDRSRLADSAILPDEQGDTCAGLLARAASNVAATGITRIERVMTDNHGSSKRSAAVAAVIAELGATHTYRKPHGPWQNGTVERCNRTLQTAWADRQIDTRNDERAVALAPWRETSTTQRRHGAREGKPPVSRLSPTSRPGTARRCNNVRWRALSGRGRGAGPGMISESPVESGRRRRG
jgi:hypothetical protein